MGKIHTLTIGINKYDDPNSNLSGCVNDSWDLTRLFARDKLYGDAIDRLPFFHNADSQMKLHDRKASLKTAIETVGTFLSKLNDGDFGLLWFSQHGSYIKDVSGDEVDKTDEVLVFSDFGLWTDDKIMKTLKTRNPKSLLFVGSLVLAATSFDLHALSMPPAFTLS